MKENKNVDEYLELSEKGETECHMKVEIILIVIRAMVIIPKHLKIDISALGALTTALIGTGRILRNIIN